MGLRTGRRHARHQEKRVSRAAFIVMFCLLLLVVNLLVYAGCQIGKSGIADFLSMIEAELLGALLLALFQTSDRNGERKK